VAASAGGDPRGARPIDHYLRDISPAFGRIARGQSPTGSGVALGAPQAGLLESETSLTDYIYLPGREGGQTVNGAVTFAGTVTLSGQENVTDSLFSILDNLDATKIVQFQCSGITTGTTRTLTVPDASGTIPTLENAQTFTAANIFQPSASAVSQKCVGASVGTLDIWQGKNSAGSVFTTLNSAGEFGVFEQLAFYRSQGTGDESGIDSLFGNVALIVATSVTGTKTFTLPNLTGTFALLTGAQTFASKTLDATNILIASTSSSGVSFTDTTTATKKLRAILSGAVGNNSLTLANTAARDYKMTDYTASAVLVGNTAAAAGTLGIQDLTAQAGSITAKTMLTSSANSSGVFRVIFYIVNTVVGNVADTLKVTVAWNDGAAQTADVLLTNAIAAPAASAVLHSLTTVGNASYGSVVAYAAASTALTFTTTATLVGTPQYTIRARIEALG